MLCFYHKSEKYITVSNNITNNFCNCDQLKSNLKCQQYHNDNRMWIGMAFVVLMIISLLVLSYKVCLKKNAQLSPSA